MTHALTAPAPHPQPPAPGATLRRGLVRAGIVIVLACLVFGPVNALAQSQVTDLQKEILDLHQAAGDSTQALSVIPRIRQILAGDLNSDYVGFVRQILLRALIVSGAPGSQVAAAADSVVPYLADNPRVKVQFYGLVASTLLFRNGDTEDALRFARSALDACPDDYASAALRAECMTLVSQVEIERGDVKPAVEMLNQALPASPDSQRVLLTLGRAYERQGKNEKAMNAYVRAIGVFPCKDTSATAKLRELYRKSDKGLAEMEARIDEACRASRKLVALDAHRHEAPAPQWELPDLDGNLVHSSDFDHKVVVVDFWGSWCGPCRAELPRFQALYERYRDRKDVAFISINWEKAPTDEERLQAAKSYMERMNLDFPTVQDNDRQAAIGFGVEAFPSVFLIDRNGRVRYRNVGYAEEIEDILNAQLESLLD